MDFKLYTSESDTAVKVTTHMDRLQLSNPLDFIIDPRKPEDARPFNHNVHHLILQCTQTMFSHAHIYLITD